MTTPRIAKFLIPVVLIIGAAVVALNVVKSRLESTPQGSVLGQRAEVRLGGKVPDFPLQIFQGKETKFSELKSKVLLINFWATWCSACIIEMPSIVKLRSLYHDKGFDVIAVNLDDNPDAVVPRSLKQLGITFPVYTDPSGKLGELFDVHAIPLTVILRQDGLVLKIHAGDLDWSSNEVKAEVEKWLAG